MSNVRSCDILQNLNLHFHKVYGQLNWQADDFREDIQHAKVTSEFLLMIILISEITYLFTFFDPNFLMSN